MSDPERMRELLNEVHSFPTRVVVKVIGNHDDDFEDLVVAAISEVLRLEELLETTSRRTPAGRHIAITCEPLFQNAEEVLEVYARLKEVPGVVMLL